jgi:hypothetical protein
LCQGFDHPLNPQDLDGSLDVVGQDGKVHIGPDVEKLPGQEIPLISVVLDHSLYFYSLSMGLTGL